MRLGKGTKKQSHTFYYLLDLAKLVIFELEEYKSKTFGIKKFLLDLTIEQEYSTLQLVILQVLALRLL